MLLIGYKSSKGIVTNQIRYFFVSSIIGWLGPAFMWMIEFRIDIYPYSNFMVAFFPAILAYAIIRYHLLDISVAITRVGIFLTLYAIVLGVPFYVGIKTNSWLWSIIVAVCLASIGPVIYRLLGAKAENILLVEESIMPAGIPIEEVSIPA